MTTAPADPPVTACGPGERIEGLCAWRALLMLAGVLLHATMGQEDRPVFAAMNIVSGSFRMGTFFMISGLLSGFALMRRSSPGAWARGRLGQLGVPTLFGLVVICPLIGIVNGSQATPLWAFNPYHLWFLVALLVYTVAAYAIHRLDLSWRVFDRVERRSSTARMLQFAVLAVTGLASFILMGIAFPILAALPAAVRPIARELPLLTGYAPAFLLGFAAARVPTIRRTLTASVRVPTLILVLAGVALLVRQLWPPVAGDAGAWWSNLVTVVCAAWCPPAAAALILRSAMAIRRVPMPLRRVADASFTIYILHYPVIAALHHVAGGTPADGWELFALLAAVGGLAPYALHQLVVRRAPLLRWLLNGQSIAPSSPTTPGVPRDLAVKTLPAGL